MYSGNLLLSQSTVGGSRPLIQRRNTDVVVCFVMANSLTIGPETISRLLKFVIPYAKDAKTVGGTCHFSLILHRFRG